MHRAREVRLGDHIAAAMRCVVLITVFVMTEWARPAAGFTELDWVVVIGSAYVLVTTFARTPRAGAGRDRAIIFTVLDLLLITWLVRVTGGLRSELYVLYYLPVLQAALRLDLRDAVGASLLAAGCYILIGFIGGPLEAPIPVTGKLRMATFSVSAITIATVLGAVAKQARLQRDERARAQELLDRTAAIYEVARTINANLDLEQLVAQLAQIAARECAADAVRVVLLSGDGEPHVRAVAGRAEILGEGDQSLEAVTWVLKHEETLAIKAGRPAPKDAPQVRAPGGVDHYLAAPMIGRGRLAGAIELASCGEGFRDADQDLLSVIAAQAAVAIENARQYGRAQLLAMTDPLTGMWNHAEFHERLREEIARAQRHGRPVSLLFADVDNFKAFNDLHGHRLGDELLRQVAARIQSAVRGSDIAARYGGDEFGVILPETPVQGASVGSDNLRRAVATEPFRVGGHRVNVTISGGVAAYPEDGATAEELIDACDLALGEAKRSGGNYIRLRSQS
jgi:diguanylate cyclase (GGDEF)-like protein